MSFNDFSYFNLYPTMRIAYIIFSILLFSSGVSSQFRFRHITVNEGLSQNSVHAIFQDREGFLWFGTQDGLNRFDGISFKVFKHSNEDSTTISDNYILAITEDRNNNLWIATRNGANRFDKTTEIFHRYYFPEMYEYEFHQTIQEIIVDNDGNIVMILPNGLYSFSPQDNFSSPSLLYPFRKKHEGVKVVHDSRSNFWMISADGIFCIRRNQKEIFYSFEKPIQGGGSLALRDSSLWIAQEEKLMTFSLSSRTFRQFPLHNQEKKVIQSLYVDSQQRLWVTTERKVIVLTEISYSNFQQTILQRNEGDKFGLNDEVVQCIREDRAGLFWFGTMHGGVNVYDPLQSQFKTIDESMLKTLPTVWAICEDSRKIFWFGTSSGLVKATRKDTSRLVTSYPSIKDAFTSFEIVPLNNASTQISTIVEDDEHQLWLGIRGNGVLRYDVEKKTSQHFLHSENDTNSLANNSILSTRKMSNGDILICTFNGISIFDRKKNSFRNIYLRKYDSSIVNYCIDVYEGKDSTMWISTTTGMARYDVKNNSMKIFQHKDNIKQGLSYNIVTSFFEDDKNQLWIATLGSGLNLYNGQNDTFEYFSSVQGLANDVVYGMCADKNNNVWLSTNEGISRFNTGTKTFTNFGIEEGLQFKEFGLNSFFQNANGEIFFGGVGGVVAFHSDSISENRFVPPIVLSDLKINYTSLGRTSSSLISGSHTIPKEIHLSYLEKTLTLEFVALNFRNSQKNKYQYKLEGFDDNWISPEQNLRVAHYTSLPSGEFTFVVKAANNSGVWNNDGLKIKIIVFPPFWLSWWFLSMMSVFVLGTVVISVRSYSHKKLRRKLQELETQQKIQTERERISRDLHDNVGSQLVNIISGLDIANRFSETSKEKTKSLLSSLQEDARTSMSLLRQTIWALKTNALTLEQFSDELENYVQKQCSYHEEIVFHFGRNFSHSIILSPIQVLNLFRITQEAVTNTFKYAKAKNIFLSLTISENNQLTLSIKDDGVGLQESGNDSFAGNGMMNMERRAKELSGEFQCVNENGVLIEVRIPV
ncbi:MAG: hypothetical protein KGZ58_02440 [Ignavibacteriales bacterium]|nr:hypothetical protein [Ignavibacteriales bacterium]